MSETLKPTTETLENEEVKQESPLEQISHLPNIPSVRQEFIHKRTQELGKNSTRRIDTDQYLYAPIVDGFFDSEMKIQPGSGNTFSVDDDSIYERAIDKISKYGDSRALIAVQHATTEYFGTLVPNAEQEAIRNAKFDMPSPESKNYSVSDNKEGALCTERAAVAHNLLQFMGIESHFVLGNMVEKTASGEKDERHSFLLIKPGDTYLIYDPTNPTYCYGDEELTEFQQYLPYTIDTGMKELSNANSTFTDEAITRFKNRDGTKGSKKKCDRTYTIG